MCSPKTLPLSFPRSSLMPLPSLCRQDCHQKRHCELQMPNVPLQGIIPPTKSLCFFSSDLCLFMHSSHFLMCLMDNICSSSADLEKEVWSYTNSDWSMVKCSISRAHQIGVVFFPRPYIELWPKFWRNILTEMFWPKRTHLYCIQFHKLLLPLLDFTTLHSSTAEAQTLLHSEQEANKHRQKINSKTLNATGWSQKFVKVRIVVPIFCDGKEIDELQTIDTANNWESSKPNNPHTSTSFHNSRQQTVRKWKPCWEKSRNQREKKLQWSVPEVRQSDHSESSGSPRMEHWNPRWLHLLHPATNLDQKEREWRRRDRDITDWIRRPPWA